MEFLTYDTTLCAVLLTLTVLLFLLIARRHILRPPVSDVRVTKGVARYEVNFVEPQLEEIIPAHRPKAQPEKVMKPCTEEELKASIDKWRKHFKGGNWR